MKDRPGADRQRLNLNDGSVDYLTVSVEVVANPATNDAAIYWFFGWLPST